MAPTDNDYNKWPTRRLQEHANQRGLQVQNPRLSSHPPLRRDYVAALKEADRERNIFPFFKLSAELRNMIYNFSVSTGRAATCFTTLITTSRQTWIEASGILYAGNEFEINIKSSTVEMEGVQCGTYMRHSSLVVRELIWPEVLRKAQRITVKLQNLPTSPSHLNDDLVAHYPLQVHQNRHHPGILLPLINNILYSLCVFLAHDNKVKSVTVDMDLDRHDLLSQRRGNAHSLRCTRCLHDAFSPLAMLKHQTTITIPGLSSFFENGIRLAVATHRPWRSLQHRWEHILHKVEPLRTIYKILQPLDLCDGTQRQFRRARDVTYRLERIEARLYPSWPMMRNKLWEQQVLDESSQEKLSECVDIGELRREVAAQRKEVERKFAEVGDILDAAEKGC